MLTSKTHGLLKPNSKRRTSVGPISKERTSAVPILGTQILVMRTLLRHTFQELSFSERKTLTPILLKKQMERTTLKLEKTPGLNGGTTCRETGHPWCRAITLLRFGSPSCTSATLVRLGFPARFGTQTYSSLMSLGSLAQGSTLVAKGYISAVGLGYVIRKNRRKTLLFHGPL